MASKTSTDTSLDNPVTDLENGILKPAVRVSTESEDDFLTGKKLFLVAGACALAMFLVALDRTIIATAVPKITDEFHSLADVGWYASSYLITSCATQLMWGRFYSFYSSKTVYLTAVGLFELGSIVCGAAPNSNAFIVGRAIAGLGSAGIFSGSVILLTHVVPLHKRPALVGMMGSIFGISSVVGPLLGGAFTDKATWRWCFYINLPIGAVTFVILVFILRLSSVKPVSLRQQIKQLDPYGTVVFLPSIVCFLLALQWGGSTYAWNDARVIALFVVAGVLFVTFVGIQIWQQENATVPPRIITQRSIACAAMYTACVGGAMISLVYYVPLWFQAIKGVSAVQSGINSLPLVLSLVVAAITAGSIIGRTGYYNPWMIICSILMSIGAGLITTFKVDTGSPKWIGYQVLFGFGLGLGMQQASMAAQTVLAKKDVSIGVSIMFLCQSLGGAIFVCISQALLTNSLVSSLERLTNINPVSIIMAGATQLRDIVSAEDLPMVLELYNAAITKAFTVALAVSCFSFLPALGMEWKSVKGRMHGGPSTQVNAEPVEKATQENERVSTDEATPSGFGPDSVKIGDAQLAVTADEKHKSF